MKVKKRYIKIVLNRKRRLIGMAIIWLIVLSLHGVEVYLNNENSVTGIELFELKQDLMKQKAINGELRQKVLEAQSMGTVESQAFKMGFQEGEVIYLYE